MTTNSEPSTGRSLAYLFGIPIDRVKGIGPRTAKKLSDAGIASVGQLLLHAPRRYLDRSQLFDLSSVPLGEEVTVGGLVTSTSRRRISRNRTMVEATITDGTSTLKAVWFNPYLKITEGEEVALSGKAELFRGHLQMKAPDLDRLGGEDSLVTGRLLPIYPKIGGMSPRKLLDSMANALRRSRPITEIVPLAVLDGLDLIDRDSALAGLHDPTTTQDVERARRRLIFDEFLRIQMVFKKLKYDEYESQAGVENSKKGKLYDRFMDVLSLQFQLTPDQIEAVETILEDMSGPRPMHRLLQGEVGSGKTIVVIIALLTSVESEHQGAVMAPTEVLATQHYLGTQMLLEDAGLAPPVADTVAGGTRSMFQEDPQEDPTEYRGVRIGLFTGSKVTTNFVEGDLSRSSGLDLLRRGEIDVAFGTQALIQSDVEFSSLGIAVVDEQHRFGVEQRVILRDQHADAGIPDLLLMTATPIPRTLAMVEYGDLDVSTIVTMPPGRLPVVTEAVPESADSAIDSQIRATVEDRQQVFIVCPLVDDSDKIAARSAAAEFERVRASLPDTRSELIHGQMQPDQKADVMRRFRAGEVDVLVATTVIEVGIDVPNATLMVIRNADRFGLSQLHQLRGRVGRGDRGGTCILAADPLTPDGERRIEAMVEHSDGFELARIDLEIRGQGTVFGGTQSGAADLQMGDILRDADLLEAANAVAKDAVDANPDSAFVRDVSAEAAGLFGDAADWLTRS